MKYYAKEKIAEGDLGSAQAALENVLANELIEESADLYALLGEVHSRYRRFEKAEQCLRKALILERANVLALNNLMVLLLEKQDGPGLQRFLSEFPFETSSVPERFKMFIRRVTETLTQDLSNMPSQAVTEEEMFRRLLERARSFRPGSGFAAERQVLSDVALSPNGEPNGAILIVATSTHADELPLKRVYLRTPDRDLELTPFVSRQRIVPEEQAEVRTMLGEYLFEAVYCCPLLDGTIMVDFANRRTEVVVQHLSLPDPHSPVVGNESAEDIARREFPYLFEQLV